MSAPTSAGPKQHSASATARPPSLRSWADSTAPIENQFANGRLHPLLILHIQPRWNTPQGVANHFGVLSSSELIPIGAPKPPSRMIVIPAVEMECQRAQRSSSVPTMPTTGVGKDRRSQRLVVQTHIATRNRNFEEPARLSQTFQRFDDLRHDFWSFRIAEIQDYLSSR